MRLSCQMTQDGNTLAGSMSLGRKPHAWPFKKRVYGTMYIVVKDWALIGEEDYVAAQYESRV